jgi:serine/threonine protein phosphatase PrpC
MVWWGPGSTRPGAFSFSGVVVDSALLVVPAKGRGQDRAFLRRVGESIVFAVADGAGGTSHGAEAAEAIISLVSARAEELASKGADAFARVLRDADRDLVPATGGETTGVIGVFCGIGLAGASVGDSGALLVGDAILDLTAGQDRKPLLGSRIARPQPFERSGARGTLVVATDGLLKYATTSAIGRVLAAIHDLEAAARAVIDLARLPSGQLPDDAAVALIRGLR